MLAMKTNFVITFLLFVFGECIGQADAYKLLVVIDIPNHPHHVQYGKIAKRHIDGQSAILKSKLTTEVILSAEHWHDLKGTWTYQTLIREVLETFDSDSYDWLLVIPDYTELNLTNILTVIESHDSTKPLFLGRALVDTQHAIIHHYEQPGFYYPDFGSGVLMSWILLKQPHMTTKDFNIDAKFELAKYFHNDGKGTALSSLREFCAPDARDAHSCATFYSVESMLCPPSSIHKAVNEDDIFVMVKTGEVFHNTRVPLQQRLWTRSVRNLEICSEVENSSIPTVKVDAPNTKTGHCAKFYAMLKRAYKQDHINSKKWVVIVDDDTIMNVTRLLKLLSCYSDPQPVVIGERYGYMANTNGYDYVTGGGGTVLNRAAVKALMESSVKCPQPDSPDDMMLGLWLNRLDIPIVHSPLFHQAPPSTYSPQLLEHQRNYAISFHKYSPDNPEQVAKEWLGLDVNKPSGHDEL